MKEPAYYNIDNLINCNIPAKVTLSQDISDTLGEISANWTRADTSKFCVLRSRDTMIECLAAGATSASVCAPCPAGSFSNATGSAISFEIKLCVDYRQIGHQIFILHTNCFIYTAAESIEDSSNCQILIIQECLFTIAPNTIVTWLAMHGSSCE